MSKLNFTRRTFLEREEIARFQQFLADSPSENAIIGNTSQWGILRTDFQGDTDFLVEPSANAGRVRIQKAENRALTSEGLRIYQEAIDNIEIPNDNSWYWIRISHQYVNWEEGTVEVNSNGELIGTGTSFLDVLRGQSAEVPVKIRLFKIDGTPSSLNSGFYEVVDVTDDQNAILTSAVDFSNESDLKIVVIGTTPIGEAVTTEQEQGLYSYDSCNIEIVVEEAEDTEPTTGFVQDKTFYLARVKNNGGVISVEDKRSDWWEFNVVGLTDKLSVFNNLSDLQDPNTALTNLGITTAGKNIARINPISFNTYMRLNSAGTISLLRASDVVSDLSSPLNDSYSRRNQNLSDLTDVAAARTNLDVYSKSEIDSKDGWFTATLTEGQVWSDEVLALKRVGNVVTYYCRFRFDTSSPVLYPVWSLPTWAIPNDALFSNGKFHETFIFFEAASSATVNIMPAEFWGDGDSFTNELRITRGTAEGPDIPAGSAYYTMTGSYLLL